MPRSRARSHQPSSLSERPERMRPGCFANGVEHDIDPPLSGPRADLFPVIGIRVVDHVLGAQPSRERQLFLAVRRHPRDGTDTANYLERGERDTAADSPDENVVALLDTRARHHHPPRRERGKREGAGGFNWSVFRYRARVARRDRDELGQRSWKVLAEHSELHAQRVLSLEAVLAGVIAQAGIDDDRIAQLDVAGRPAAQISDGIDYPCRVGAEYPWRDDLEVGESAQHEQVEMVQADRFDADAYLAALRLGLRQIGAVLELVEPTVRRDGESSHANIGALYSTLTTN